MAFPVDMLDNCSQEELENSAEDYMSDLRCGDPENPECFSLLNITIPISLSNVGFVPLYGGDQTQKILALFFHLRIHSQLWHFTLLISGGLLMIL